MIGVFAMSFLQKETPLPQSSTHPVLRAGKKPAWSSDLTEVYFEHQQPFFMRQRKLVLRAQKKNLLEKKLADESSLNDSAKYHHLADNVSKGS